MRRVRRRTTERESDDGHWFRRRLNLVVVALWLSLSVGTGIAYLLPLSQAVTDHVSNIGFMIGGGMILATLCRAIVVVGGIDRIGWSMVLTSLTVLLVLFAIDPAASNGPPTIALGVAPFVGLSLVVVVMLFGRQGIDRLGLARLLLDGLWLTTGVIAASWHWVVAPLDPMAGNESNLLFFSFPVTVALSSAATVLLWPRITGSTRPAFAAFGVGAAVTAIAGVLHLQHANAGTLRFGTWYDFLWMIGMPLLGLSALRPDLGSGLRPTRPSARSQQVITCLPVLGLAIPLIDGEAWRTTPSALGLLMIVVLALRVVVLISQNHDLGEQLFALAHQDELTGLLNRRALLDLLADLTARSNCSPESSQTAKFQTGASYSVLYLDLDGFKSVNDRWGHAAGDHVLKETAARLRHSVRPDDVVARLGGDEFVVVVHDSGARELATRLLSEISKPIGWSTHEITIGVSIGIADAAEALTSDILACADVALYRSKVEGRNRVSFATPSTETSVAR